MDFYEVINKRRSVRKFEKKEIPDDVFERLIDAAVKAPSNDHMRDWEFIIVKDKAVAAKLLDVIPRECTEDDLLNLEKEQNLIDKAQRATYRYAVPKQYQMLYEASAIIVPLMKNKTDLMHPANISHLNPLVSIWCSVENLWLAAVEEGYGCNVRVPLGNEEEHAREILGFPEDYYMPCFIGIGLPLEENIPELRNTIDGKSRIHWNGF